MDKVPATASRLLIATDDSAWTSSVTHSLSAHGFLVRTAANGQTALEGLLTERFEFVIAALQMPKLDGIRLVTEIRKSHFLRHLPVLIVGREEGATAYERAITAGADDYVELPINNELLRLKVQGISNRARRMDALFEASLIGRFNPRQFSDIVQLLNTTNRSGLLRIFSGPSVTQIWFRNGLITFARDEMEEGIQAVYNLVKASDARFEFIEGERLNATNITRSQMFMLLEFSRKLDTYTVSRKQTIKTELDAAKDSFNALLEGGAQKYIPYIANKCAAMISTGENLLLEDNVEEASLVVRKLEDSIKWIGVELERVKNALNSVSSEKRRTTRIEKAAALIEAAREREKTEQAREEQTQSKEAPVEAAVPPAPDTEPDEFESRDTVRITAESIGKEPAQDQPVETQPDAQPQADEPPQEAIPARVVSLVSPSKAQDACDEESEEQTDIPEYVILEDEGFSVSSEAEVEEVRRQPAPTAKEAKPSVPRLIQRFPPDIVEMMQVELAKFSGTILNPEAMKEFRNRLNNGPMACTLTLQAAGKLLSEAYYSKANVLGVIVYGNAEQLAEYFSKLTGAQLPAPAGDSCLVTRITGGLSHTLYLIGLQYREMDSFEAESILDRAMGAIILGLEEAQLEDLQIDALSLALVKYRRHRVFMLYREGMLTQKVGTALSRYSLDNSRKRTDFDFSKPHISQTLDMVLESFTS